MSSSLGGRRDLGRFHVMRKCERRADPRDRIFRGERERGRVQNPPVNQQDPTPTPSARKYAHVCVPLTPFYALLPTNVAINMHLHEARGRKLHAAISAMERENDTWCEATTRLRKPPLSSRPHLVLNFPVIEKKETRTLARSEMVLIREKWDLSKALREGGGERYLVATREKITSEFTENSRTPVMCKGNEEGEYRQLDK